MLNLNPALLSDVLQVVGDVVNCAQGLTSDKVQKLIDDIRQAIADAKS